MKRCLSIEATVTFVFCSTHCTAFVSNVFGLSSRRYLAMLCFYVVYASMELKGLGNRRRAGLLPPVRSRLHPVVPWGYREPHT